MSASQERPNPSDLETAELGAVPPVHAASTVAPGGVHESALETLEVGGSRPASEPATERGALPWRVGQYEVKSELARGGMGIIYRAVHVGLGRELALKVLRLDRIGGEREVERFQLEARAAARLAHPNIVRVHDVGECVAGPYLVMDLVAGEPLSAVIRRDEALDPRAAATIAHKVAGALAYAHSRGILHRDVKPANVIISTSGEPLLTDFGLAKDLDTPDRLTETGSVVGTPAYMPPEQARGEAESVDRRSDVYSLGATLYDALTGRPPFEGPTALDTLRRVLTDEPVAPSTLRPGIDPDLETICLKCLEKEPHLRYGSAAALADDLGRYVANEAIAAARPSLLGRGRKWVRRNQTLTRALASFSAGAVVLGALGAGAFVHRLQLERDLADRQAEIARDTIDVLVYEVRDGLRDVPGGRAREVRRELLERALRGLERLQLEDRSGRVSIRSAEVHRQIGEIALTLGQTRVAEEALARAIAVLRRLSTTAGEDAAAARARLPEVLVEAAQVHRAKGDLALALASIEEALSLERGPRALTALADVLAAQGHLERARQMLEEALSYRRAAAARDPAARPDLAAALVEAGGLARRQGALATAVERYDEALSITRALVDDAPQSTLLRRAHAAHLLGAADARTDQGDHAAAGQRYEEALGLYRRLVAEDPDSVPLLLGLIDALQRLGDNAARRKAPAEALARYVEALDVCRRLEARDPEDERALERLRNLLARSGEQRRHLGDLTAARAELEEALERLGARLATSPRDAAARESFALTQARLGQVFSAQGDDDAAIAQLEAAAAALDALLAEEPSNAAIRSELLVTIGLTGELIEDTGDLERARGCYDETLRIGAELLARDESNARARANQTAGFTRVALLLHRLGDVAEALVYVGRAIETLRPLASRDAQYSETLRWLEDVVLVEFSTSLELVEGRRPPATPGEHAELGRTLLRRRAYAAASDQFLVALADAALRDDLVRQHLLHGTRAAARASAPVSPPAPAGGDTGEHRRRAVSWLAALVGRLRARIAELDLAVEAAQEEGARTPLLLERRRHERALAALRRDPDLADLTGPGGVEALLGAPAAR